MFLWTPPLFPLSSLPVFMANIDDSKTQRVKEITAFIHSKGFTLNEFLIAFYSSQDVSIKRQRGCSLTKREQYQFSPEELLDLWLKHCPSNSQGYLKSVVVDRAGEIIIKETSKACKLDSLRVPTTKIEADNLDKDFLLAKLEDVYKEALPSLWMLLNMIATSWNSLEKKKDEPSVLKESRAKFVGPLPRFHLAHLTNKLPSTGLHRCHKHSPFHEEPSHKCLPDHHGAIPWSLRCLETCVDGM